MTVKKAHEMRIKSIDVNNFKSLVGFKLDLAKFSCLIGLNGVGKSTVLQFIDFLAQLVRGEMVGWLNEREWKSGDLRSKLTAKKNIEFCVHFTDGRGHPAGRWEAHYNPSANRCAWERIDLLDFVLETTKGEVRIYKVRDRTAKDKEWKTLLTFSYEGSILSSLKEEFLPPSILNAKKFFQGIESLDMLTPERLRRRTRTADGSLGHGGRNLSAFVYELGPSGRKALAKTLKRAYPLLDHVYAKSLRSGWKQLLASEMFGDVKLLTEARHLNDGLLRLIAILAEIISEHKLRSSRRNREWNQSGTR